MARRAALKVLSCTPASMIRAMSKRSPRGAQAPRTVSCSSTVWPSSISPGKAILSGRSSQPSCTWGGEEGAAPASHSKTVTTSAAPSATS